MTQIVPVKALETSSIDEGYVRTALQRLPSGHVVSPWFEVSEEGMGKFSSLTEAYHYLSWQAKQSFCAVLNVRESDVMVSEKRIVQPDLESMRDKTRLQWQLCTRRAVPIPDLPPSLRPEIPKPKIVDTAAIDI